MPKSFASGVRVLTIAMLLLSAAAVATAQVRGAGIAIDPKAADAFRALIGGPFVEREVTLELASGTRCRLRLLLQPDHARHADRIADAAREALDQYSAWFVAYPYDSLTIVDLPFGSAAPDHVAPGLATIRARWLQPERSLTLEAQVARAVARQWWGTLIAMPDRFLADGLAEYAQSRTLERIFDRRHQRLNYSLLETRLFGGLVPWAIRAARLDRQTSGINRPAFRRDLAVDMRNASADARLAQTAKAAAALTTLERYLGWPALQRGLSGAARRFAGGTMTAEAFYQTVGDAADRDLSWFFSQAFARTSIYDFAVAGLTSVAEANETCGPGPCYRTTVTLRREGDALFTGTSKEPVGPFEAGSALVVQVRFADGQQSEDHWDGRAAEKTLVYHGPSPAVWARIDPDRTLLLDANRLNNTRALNTPPSAVTLPWSIRWTTWLQDLMLSYSFFF